MIDRWNPWRGVSGHHMVTDPEGEYVSYADYKALESKLADAEKQAEHNGEAAREAAERLKSAESRLLSLEKLLSYVVPDCERLHRPADMRHEFGAACPVEAAIRRVVERPAEKCDARLDHWSPDVVCELPKGHKGRHVGHRAGKIEWV